MVVRVFSSKVKGGSSMKRRVALMMVVGLLVPVIIFAQEGL